MSKDPAGHRAIEQSVGLAFRFLFIGVAVLAVAWLASGFVSVQAGSRAVVLRFGKVDRVGDTGLVWAWPRPIEEVVILPGPERQLTQDVGALDLSKRLDAPSDLSLDLRDGGYVLSGDGGAVHLSGVVTYHVSEVATYLMTRERLAPALERLFCASAITVIAGRGLDGVLTIRSASESGDAAIATAAQRESLRGDIRSLMNQRLKALGLGIEVNRVDLTARLPLRAKPTFDQVLASESEAARVVASARTDAEKYHQQGERDRTEIIEGAQAKAKEIITDARVATDRIVSLGAESSPDRRSQLLTRLYRERMETILRRAGLVTLVDGREPIRLLVPGGMEKK
ncbi:MAG TPA: SPFH domain-containing protein [Planctomycetota bacterium]|nr:SPFH domain-containing protein [Planctomycetota bacterium]